MKRARICLMNIMPEYYGYVMKCSVCGARHATRLYGRCPTCGRQVAHVYGDDKQDRKSLARARTLLRRKFDAMMARTNGAETARGGSGRRERRTINAVRG